MGLTWCHEERARDPLRVESGEQWAEKQGQSDRGWITQDFGGHREEFQVSHIAKHFKCVSLPFLSLLLSLSIRIKHSGAHSSDGRASLVYFLNYSTRRNC